MAKTTVELSQELKRQVEIAAKLDRRTEEEIIRAAVEEAMRKRVTRKPRLPLIADDSKFPPDLVDNIDEYLKGFGED